MDILGLKEMGYIDVVDVAILEQIEKEAQDNKFNPLRPSSAGKCQRQLGYEYMKFKGYAQYETERMSPSTFRLLKHGHTIEGALLYNFGLTDIFNIRYRQQTLTFCKLHDGTLIEGNLDAVLYSEKYRCIIDVKTKKDKFSKYYSCSWDEDTQKFRDMKSLVSLSDNAFYADDLKAFLEEVKDEFLRDNFYQLNLYANADFIRERGIDHAAIIQYNKNDSRLREIRFRPSEELALLTCQKFQLVAQTVDTTKDPNQLEADCALGSMKCAFCPFAKYCRPEDTLKAFFNTLESKSWAKQTAKLGNIGDQLEELYTEYKALATASEKQKEVELKLTHLMESGKLYKVKFSDGKVFESKYLKTPREHYEFRRSK